MSAEEEKSPNYIGPPSGPDIVQVLPTRMNWVVSYPKSGNTWIRMVCAAYATGADDKEGLEEFTQTDDVHPYAFQAVSPIPINKLGLGAQAQMRPAAMVVLAKESSGPSLVKSHHAHVDLNGVHLWQRQWTRKVLNPVRDPRDVCCSAANHFGQTHEEAAEFMNKELPESTIGRPLTHMLGTWSQHVRSWMDSDLDVHTVRYEDMLDNTYEEFHDMLEFLDVQLLEEDRLRNAIELCAFDNLQQLEDEAGFTEKSEHQDRFFRKGEAGGWKDELDPKVARKIEQDHGDVMEELGYL